MPQNPTTHYTHTHTHVYTRNLWVRSVEIKQENDVHQNTVKRCAPEFVKKHTTETQFLSWNFTSLTYPVFVILTSTAHKLHLALGVRRHGDQMVAAVSLSRSLIKSGALIWLSLIGHLIFPPNTLSLSLWASSHRIQLNNLQLTCAWYICTLWLNYFQIRLVYKICPFTSTDNTKYKLHQSRTAESIISNNGLSHTVSMLINYKHNSTGITFSVIVHWQEMFCWV